MIVRYNLRINGKKHPEVVAALEKAKGKDGIALYIRQLVEKDLQAQNTPITQQQPLLSQQTVLNEVAATTTIEQFEAQQLNDKSNVLESNEDFAGGLI